MRKDIPRRRRLTLTAGLVLGVGGAIAVGQLTGQAAAQSPPTAVGGVTLSAQQLLINQRISQAAVRRSNESLRLLEPIRPYPSQPDRVLGWRTDDIRDNAITSSKLSNALRESQPRWAVINGATGERVRQQGATASTKAAEGRYTVTWDRDIRACAYQATVAALGTEQPPVNRLLTVWPDAANNRVLHVHAAVPVVNGATDPSTDTPFHVTVLC